jgi:hypothetical protein
MNYINKLNSPKRNLYFFAVSKKMALKNLFLAKKENQYLFILSPPFCGSTLLTEIISTSKNVSCNNNIGLREGQHLPGLIIYYLPKIVGIQIKKLIGIE